jgi:integrase
MGRKSVRSCVRAKGKHRIEFDFEFQGKRYRPTLKRAPTEGNLRRAIKQLEGIRERIAQGVFDFSEEFPNYKFKDDIPEVREKEFKRKTCGDVFDGFLTHCEMRVAMNDMAFSTLNGYRKLLESIWRPRIGKEAFEEVVYSRLAKIAAAHTKNKKTYNNVVSAVRCAFDFGYKDHPEKHNPASGLTTLRISKKDRPVVDPFTIQEAEIIIARSHTEFGAAHGNYEEFRFFTGLRQSEQIILEVGDCDLDRGVISITKARVLGRKKDRTKTREDREIRLCGRALDVLKRQLVLRGQLMREGTIDHDFVFFQEDGRPILNLSYPYDRWRYVLEATAVRYRDAYNTRHSFISWRLMMGDNVLLVAQEDGHSVQTMLTTYAAWTKGATEADVAAIKRAITCSPTPLYKDASPSGPLESPGAVTRLSLDEGWGRLSWRKYRSLNGGADGTRTRDPRRDRPVF